jgi:hypothetical protein
MAFRESGLCGGFIAWLSDSIGGTTEHHLEVGIWLAAAGFAEACSLRSSEQACTCFRAVLEADFVAINAA